MASGNETNLDSQFNEDYLSQETSGLEAERAQVVNTTVYNLEGLKADVISVIDDDNTYSNIHDFIQKNIESVIDGGYDSGLPDYFNDFIKNTSKFSNAMNILRDNKDSDTNLNQAILNAGNTNLLELIVAAVRYRKSSESEQNTSNQLSAARIGISDSEIILSDTNLGIPNVGEETFEVNNPEHIKHFLNPENWATLDVGQTNTPQKRAILQAAVWHIFEGHDDHLPNATSGVEGYETINTLITGTKAFASSSPNVPQDWGVDSNASAAVKYLAVLLGKGSANDLDPEDFLTALNADSLPPNVEKPVTTKEVSSAQNALDVYKLLATDETNSRAEVLGSHSSLSGYQTQISGRIIRDASDPPSRLEAVQAILKNTNLEDAALYTGPVDNDAGHGTLTGLVRLFASDQNLASVQELVRELAKGNLLEEITVSGLDKVQKITKINDPDNITVSYRIGTEDFEDVNGVPGLFSATVDGDEYLILQEGDGNVRKIENISNTEGIQAINIGADSAASYYAQRANGRWVSFELDRTASLNNTTYNVTVSEAGGNETLTFASQSEETTSALTQSHEQRILTDGPTITATKAPGEGVEWIFTGEGLKQDTLGGKTILFINSKFYQAADPPQPNNVATELPSGTAGDTSIIKIGNDYYPVTDPNSNNFLRENLSPLGKLTLDGDSNFTLLKTGNNEYQKVSGETELTIEGNFTPVNITRQTEPVILTDNANNPSYYEVPTSGNTLTQLTQPTVKDATGTAITELTILKGSGDNPDYYEVSSNNTLIPLTQTSVSQEPAAADSTATLQNVLYQEDSNHVYVPNSDGNGLTQIALTTPADDSARTFSHGDNTFSLTPGSSPNASAVPEGNGEGTESTTHSQTIGGKTITATPPSGGSTEWTYKVGNGQQTPVNLGTHKLLKIGNNYHKIVDPPNVENSALTKTTVTTAAESASPENLVVLQDGGNFYFRQGESGDFTQINSPEDIPGGVLSVTGSTVSFIPSPIESETYNITNEDTTTTETINRIENGLFAKINTAFSDQDFLDGLNESLTQVHSKNELLLSLQVALLNWDAFDKMDNSDTKLTQAAETLFRLINKEALKKYREEKAGETPPSGSDLSQIFNRGYIIKVDKNFKITLNAGSRRLTVDPTTRATAETGNAVSTAPLADAGVSDSGIDHGREAPTTLEWTENGLSAKLLESLTDIQFPEGATLPKQINTLQFIGQDHMANVDNLIKALHTSTEGVFDEEFKEFRTAYEKFVSQRSILRQNKFGRMSIMDIITSAGREHSTADDKSDWKKTTYRASLQGAMKRHGDREIITNPSESSSEKHKKSDLSSELSDLYEYAEQALLKAKAMVDKINDDQATYGNLQTQTTEFSEFLSVAAEQFDADRPGWFKDWAED